MSLNICQAHSIQPILPRKPEGRVGGEKYLQSKSKLRDIEIKSLRGGVQLDLVLFDTYGVQLCTSFGEAAPYCNRTTSSFQQGCVDVCVGVCVRGNDLKQFMLFYNIQR